MQTGTVDDLIISDDRGRRRKVKAYYVAPKSSQNLDEVARLTHALLPQFERVYRGAWAYRGNTHAVLLDHKLVFDLVIESLSSGELSQFWYWIEVDLYLTADTLRNYIEKIFKSHMM